MDASQGSIKPSMKRWRSAADQAYLQQQNVSALALPGNWESTYFRVRGDTRTNPCNGGGAFSPSGGKGGKPLGETVLLDGDGKDMGGGGTAMLVLPRGAAGLYNCTFG